MSPATRTFTVEVRVPDPGGRLKPGLFARAGIQVGRTEAVFAVPETAVASVAGVHKVFVEVGGKASARDVRLVRKRGGDALVVGVVCTPPALRAGSTSPREGDATDCQPTAPLSAGDRIIVTGVARLFDGVEVKVDAPAEPPR